MIPDVSFMVPVLGRPQQTRRCIESLARQQGITFEILVIDNGSDTKTKRMLEIMESRIQRMTLFNPGRNLGYTGGQEFLAKRAQGNFFCLCSNDISLGPQSVKQMLAAFRDRNVGQVGPQQRFGYLNDSGVGCPRSGLPPQFINRVKRVEYIDGCCYIIRRNTYDDAGYLFHPDYEFMYCEDADMSLRLRSKGLRIVTMDVRFSRDESVKSSTAMDVEGARLRNHLILQKHWGAYLETRMSPPRNGPAVGKLAEVDFEAASRTVRKVDTRTIHLARSGARGDVLMLTPIARALKRSDPNLRVELWTCAPDLISSQFIDSVNLVKSYPPHVTAFGDDKFFFLDMTYERNPNKHAVHAYADAVGVAVDNTRPDISVSGEEIAKAKKLVGSRNFVLFDIGASWANRQWPLHHYTKTAEFVRSRGLVPIAIGVGRDIPVGLEHITSPKMFDLVPLFALARAFVGHDGAWMHVAQAFYTPSVLLFSVAAPTTRVTIDDQTRIIERDDLRCLHCLQRRPAPRQYTPCDQGHFLNVNTPENECMNIHADSVINALEGLL